MHVTIQVKRLHEIMEMCGIYASDRGCEHSLCFAWTCKIKYRKRTQIEQRCYSTGTPKKDNGLHGPSHLISPLNISRKPTTLGLFI